MTAVQTKPDYDCFVRYECISYKKILVFMKESPFNVFGIDLKNLELKSAYMNTNI